MNLTVEFSGVARAIAGANQTLLTLPDRGTYHDVVCRLSELYPALVGIQIAPDRVSLLNANVFSRNGDNVILPDMMGEMPADGDRLILITIIVGG